MSNAPKVLVAAASDPLRAFLADNLTADGFATATADSLAQARVRLQIDKPELVILGELDAPAHAPQLIRAARAGELRSVAMDTAFLMLVPGTGSLERLRAFEAGADDVVGLPFSYPEMRARVRAVLRRLDARVPAQIMRVGALEFDVTARRVRIDEHVVELSGKEFDLLAALIAQPTRVFTKQELLRTVWRYRGDVSSRTVDSHACRLRRKLTVGEHRFLTNVWGVGYRLVDELPEPVAA